MVEVIAFTGTLTNTGEYRVTTMCLGDVVDQFHDQDGLANTSTTKQADLAALRIWREKVNNLDTRYKNFSFRGLIDIFGCRTVDRILLL